MKKFAWGLAICWLLAFCFHVFFTKPDRDSQLVGVASDLSYKSGIPYETCYRKLRLASNEEVARIANEWGIDCPDLD